MKSVIFKLFFIYFAVSDEELFEDNPEEYIRRDIEGSDIDTRRRAACDLVKTLSQNFEAKIFEIFGQYLQVLLSKYAENPAQNWRAKDTAIFLVTSFASRGSTQKHGVTQTSQLVPLPEFCQQQIIPELERPNINELPVLKADALKFVMTFRTLLGAQTMVTCLPQSVRHLSSESSVVSSYAACTIEKVLIMRGSDNNLSVTVVQLQPIAGDLLNGLFAVLSGTQPNNENEYVMKAIMRSFATLQEASMPFMSAVLPRLIGILEQVSKNPSRPHFNHYLFETLALAIKIVCVAEPSAVSSFEEALFPIFQNILQQDILEFMPYVFQMLALLLEMREKTNTIPEAYWALFPCLLSPALWDRSGNVTPLIRLICSFIRQGAPQVAAMQKLNAILGVFQKMIASKANDHEGFFLLQNLIQFYPITEIQSNIRQIYALLFQRLSSSKTAKYVRGFIGSMAFYSAKVGATQLVELIDNIQAQMFGMVIERILCADLTRVTGDIDKKIVAMGVTKILCECPSMLTPPYRNYWPGLLQALITSFEMPPDETTLEGDEFIEIENVVGYQAAYSQLNYAKLKVLDPIPEVLDGRKFLAENLAKLSQQRPGDISTLIAALPPDHQQALQKYCAQSGVQIV